MTEEKSNSLSRVFRRVALSLTLALGLGGAASAQEAGRDTTYNDKSPEAGVYIDRECRVTPMVIHETTLDTTGIFALRAEFNRTAMGRDLLAFADENGIRIAYDPDLHWVSRTAEYDDSKKLATVRPGISITEQLVSLAHEIRHAVQDNRMSAEDFEAALRTPEQRWTFRQFMEADARAYSMVFWAERMIEFGDTAVTPGIMASDLPMALALRHQMLCDGLTLDEYRDLALIPCFANLQTYIPVHLAVSRAQLNPFGDYLAMAREKMDSCDYAGATLILAQICRHIADMPDDAEFAGFLRRFGGLDNTMSGETAFSNVADESMLYFFAYLYNRDAIDDAKMARVGQFIQDMQMRFDEMQGIAQDLLKTAFFTKPPCDPPLDPSIPRLNYPVPQSPLPPKTATPTSGP